MDQRPIFTRYLYIKEEVEYALFLSLLEKRTESSLFWAFELYNSGFQRETIELLWYIYTRFYEETNPHFKNVFEKKEKKFCESSKEEQKIIFGSIIYNLARHDVSFKITKVTIKNTLLREKYKKRGGSKKMEEDQIKLNEKKLYVVLNANDIQKYKTQTIQENSLNKCIQPHQIMPLAITNSTNESKWFSSCSLDRKSIPQEKMREMYHDQWLYYASFSPIWRERIQQRNGTINHETKRVEFNEENDDFDNFHNSFGYEPDEQKKEIQEKNIPILILTF